MNLSVNTEIAKKPFGIWTLTALVVGNMVGSGIFLLPNDLVKFGQESFIAWFITIIGAFLLALTLSNSCRFIKRDGGPYAFAKSGLGRFVGFQTVYNHWIAVWIGNLGVILAFISYIKLVFPVFSSPIYSTILGFAVIWLLTIINTRGAKIVGKIQLVTVFLKLLPIVMLIGFGVWFFDLNNLHGLFDFSNQAHEHVKTIASLTLWAFIGIESATIPYNSVENPQRNIPLATLFGTVIAATVYVVSSTVILGIVPKDMIVAGTSAFMPAAEMIFGSWGKWLMVGGAIVSCLGCANGWTFIKGQIAMAGANDNLFPYVFGVKNKFGVPARGLIMTAVLESLVLILALHDNSGEKFGILIFMASFGALIPFLYASLSSIVLIRACTTMNLLKDKLMFFVASLASIYAFWMLSIAGIQTIYYGAILLLISSLLYCWGYGKKYESNLQ